MPSRAVRSAKPGQERADLRPRAKHPSQDAYREMGDDFIDRARFYFRRVRGLASKRPSCIWSDEDEVLSSGYFGRRCAIQMQPKLRLDHPHSKKME